MELYGLKAWALVGLAVAGWALCLAQYRALVGNYTALANQSLAVARALGNLTLANVYALNQSIALLNNVYYELQDLNATLTQNDQVLGQVLAVLRAVNESLTTNDKLLWEFVSAINRTR